MNAFRLIGYLDCHMKFPTLAPESPTYTVSMKTIRAFSLLAVILLLSSCAVTVEPGTGIAPHAVGVSGGQTVNDRLGLNSYPGSVIVKQQEDRSSSETTFETGASLDAVYAHFHRQLSNSGWLRYELETKRHKVEARYGSSRGDLELELKREGNSGRYQLKLELD